MRTLLLTATTLLVSVLGAASVGSTPAMAAAQSSCFMCDDWYDATQDMWYHVDVTFFNNDKQGIKHTMSTPFSCGMHTPYVGGGSGGGKGYT